MADILDKFIEKAKENVASGYYRSGTTYSGARNSLAARLSSRDFSLIAEIKHASPAGEYSFGNIDVKKTARDFLECGADAISVVVEPQVFRGSLGNVPVAKSAGLPVLFKDFVISEEQLEAAARVGADAVLLVVKVADRLGLDLDALIEKAHELGLEVLLECYDEDEMARAVKTKADILGINNRDLRTLRVDISLTGSILSKFPGILQPVISESGIRGIEDARQVRKYGARGILVGTAIWKADDLRAKIKELKSDG
ncbi:MAG: indole-3-glycerol-phosphate synthase [Candidatus Micrarchaeota archaeon]|nr:indole-3-glycerol-phosphate synthase [Candidatus Micrarchaeota archaeon]